MSKNMNFETFYSQMRDYWLKQKIGEQGEDNDAYLITYKNGKLAFGAIVAVDNSPMLAAKEFLKKERPDFYMFVAEAWMATQKDYTPNSGWIRDLPRDKRTETFVIASQDLSAPNSKPKSETFEIVRDEDDKIVELKEWGKDGEFKTRFNSLESGRPGVS